MSTATATKTTTKPVKAAKALAAPTPKPAAVDPISEALAAADVTPAFDLAALQALRAEVKANSNRGKKKINWTGQLAGHDIFIYAGQGKPFKMKSAAATASRIREQMKEEGLTGWIVEVFGSKDGQPVADKTTEHATLVLSKF